MRIVFRWSDSLLDNLGFHFLTNLIRLAIRFLEYDLLYYLVKYFRKYYVCIFGVKGCLLKLTWAQCNLVSHQLYKSPLLFKLTVFILLFTHWCNAEHELSWGRSSSFSFSRVYHDMRNVKCLQSAERSCFFNVLEAFLRTLGYLWCVIPSCWRIGNTCCRSSPYVHAWVVGMCSQEVVLYRYIDCIITVPLQMIEFNFILQRYIAISGFR